MPRLDQLRHGDWVWWQERRRKVANVQRVAPHLVCVSFYTEDKNHQLTTRAIGSGIRVPEGGTPSRHDDE